MVNNSIALFFSLEVREMKLSRNHIFDNKEHKEMLLRYYEESSYTVIRQ